MNKNEGKILGIIGGMGPMASSVFYRMLIRMTPAHRDQDHINIILLSHATMPDRTESIRSGHVDELLARLREDARFLEDSGADFIAVPCNTSHALLDLVQESVGIPILHMIRETAAALAGTWDCRGSKVGILATDGTLLSGIYQKELEAAGIEPVVPSEDIQKTVMSIIYDGVKAGEPVNPADFARVEAEMRQKGCKKVILACTELSCYKEDACLGDYYIDAMEILAGKAIERCKTDNIS